MFTDTKTEEMLYMLACRLESYLKVTACHISCMNPLNKFCMDTYMLT